MSIRWKVAATVAWTVLLGPRIHRAVAAQVVPAAPVATARDRVTQGDREYAERRGQSALDQYLSALALDPKHYEALWKASRVEVDLAENMAAGSAQDAIMTSARQHAEAAVAVSPNDAEGHFSLARALGRKALSVGTMDRIRYSKLVRNEALEALRIDSTHAGALHVLGMWHAEIRRVNGLARTFARTFLGAGVFSLASWDEAQRLLEASVRHDPNRIVHHLDLAGIYADRGAKDKAAEQYELIARAPVREMNDPLYKAQAAVRLKKQ